MYFYSPVLNEFLILRREKEERHPDTHSHLDAAIHQ